VHVNRNPLKQRLAAGLATIVLLVTALSAHASGPARDARGERGMVAAAHPLASQAGIEILKAGGNAVDAAVAVSFALGSVEPNASGIGGGGFMLIWLAESRRAVFIDFREKAPAGATADMFEVDAGGQVLTDQRGYNPAIVGGRSVAVPGNVAGLLYALEHFGSMNRQQVMQPAIRHAAEGVPVSDVLNGMITEHYDVVAAFPESAGLYLNDGFPRMPGETVRNPGLAATLRLIAEQGQDAFYRGPVAESIVAAVQADGGVMTLEDLAGYSVSLRTPLRGSYRGLDIIAAPPPSSGGAHVIELLNIMENYEPERTGQITPERLHAWAEAMKLTFADRARYMGDTDFIDVPLEGLTSKRYARDQFARIESSRVLSLPAPGNPAARESGSTSHFSVGDAAGNLVACTQTINHFFGSGITTPGTGILLNDQMDDFDKRPGQANSIAPGKRPLSSMSPIILLEDGEPFAAIGSPGGKRIISTMALLISRMVDFDMGLQAAIESPRITNYEDGRLTIESRIPQLVREMLVLKGHELTVKKDFDLYFGGAQGVVIDHDTGELIGGADPRRDGQAIGY
jgi:gamma-glutamyltranspeptidase/glutathione hydrolase